MKTKRKRVTRLLKGAQAQWSVIDPLSEMKKGDVIDTKITHRSPTAELHILYNLDVYKHAILEWVHNWEVLIEVEFKDEKDEPEFLTVRLNESTKFHNLDDDIANSLEVIFENAGDSMARYVTTHMTATII